MMSAIYRIRRRASGHAQDEAGFTMVEMVIAIFIFAMVITGVGVGMSSALNLTRQNRNRSIAANLAAQQMDTIRSTDFDTLDQMTQLVQPVTLTPTPTVEGVPYTITQDTAWVRKNATGAAAGPCQSPPTAANPLAYIAVTTTVTWADMHGVLPVQTDTVVSPPVGVYDQTEGHIRVTVLNAAEHAGLRGDRHDRQPDRGRLRHRDHRRRRVRVLRVPADRRVHGDALVGRREGGRTGKPDARRRT